jgi:hypothetical protein
MGVLAKITVLDKVEIVEGGSVQVRWATYVTEDGVRISAPMYHRAAYVPGAELPPDIDKIVADVAAVVWTPKVLADHQKRIEDAVAALEPRSR